ncbi:hypothetical protein [Streptomyces abikoensis]|uniref:hypothetical protein n=1 Tax=Streptomyces abikoensis TaxID=97398 RepID=UPI003F53F42B
MSRPHSTAFTHEGDLPSSPANTVRLIPLRVRSSCSRWPKASGSVYGASMASDGTVPPLSERLVMSRVRGRRV